MNFKDEYLYLKQSPYFDANYYWFNYLHDSIEGDPIEHYLSVGWLIGNNPSEIFETNYYLDANPDVRAAGINPLVHFIIHGKDEGRCPAKCEAEKLDATSRRPFFSDQGRNDYEEWVNRYDTFGDSEKIEITRQIEKLKSRPLISIVMPVYDPPLDFLDQAIWSIRRQSYPNWELCIADDLSKNDAVRDLVQLHVREDLRIKLVLRQENGHISLASNSAIDLATGDFIALVDNDDLLTEHALYWIADAINMNPEAGIIYSDEDKLNEEGKRVEPYFKSEWNLYLARSHNMVCHLGVYRAELVREVGGFRTGFEGAQDHDLMLRCAEKLSPEKIVHIPKVLYHWRLHSGSTALAGEEKPYALHAGARAIDSHLERLGVKGKAELLDFGMYRVHYEAPNPEPLISMIIPTRNAHHLVKQCVESILERTDYINYEIILIDNGSDDQESISYFAKLREHPRIRVLRDDRPFNYSALNNKAVSEVHGDFVALINNDIEVINSNWLSEMVSLAIQPGAGAIGARLWYPDDRLQHAGVILGVGGVAGHSHKFLSKGRLGYFARPQLIQGMSAVTAACLLVRKSIYEEVGGLNEVDLKIAFNDIDFCLRVLEQGYQNIWTPHAELYHHESASRGHEDTPEKQARFNAEVRYMQERWGVKLQNDPAYSPNLTLEHEDFSLAWPPRLSRQK